MTEHTKEEQFQLIEYLSTPPTEAEVAEIIDALDRPPTQSVALVIRRLAFERDRLKGELSDAEFKIADLTSDLVEAGLYEER